jgi:hypothetical protein
MIGMGTPEPKCRWFYPAPNWLVLGLLAATGILFLSDRFRWFGFNLHKGWTVLTAVATVGVVLLALFLWFIIALIFRLRFQFSVRLLLVLMVTVALPFSWLAVEMKKARRQREAVAELEKWAPVVDYDWQCDSNGNEISNPQRPEPAWLRNLLGDSFFSEIFSVQASEVTDSDIAQLRKFEHLDSLFISDTPITENVLARLGELTQLKSLHIYNTDLTDAGLARLAELKQLHELEFGATKVSDDGVTKLRQALPYCEINN